MCYKCSERSLDFYDEYLKVTTPDCIVNKSFNDINIKKNEIKITNIKNFIHLFKKK